MNGQLQQISAELGANLLTRAWRVTTAESCTGGGVAAAITTIPGSSTWFEYGFVTYANNAKQTMLGVKAATLQQDGAVSEAVVLEMVAGALRVSKADIAVAISGIAGPGGGTAVKPVGSVWFAWGLASGESATKLKVFPGDRLDVQQQAVTFAIQGLLALLQKRPV